MKFFLVLGLIMAMYAVTATIDFTDYQERTKAHKQALEASCLNI